MHLLVVVDSLDRRGGAGTHVHAVIDAARSAGHRVSIACGRRDRESAAPDPGVIVVPALARPVGSDRGLSRLERVLREADAVHAQNVMNPAALAGVAGSGRAVVVVQDPRVFCPGPGRTLPDGSRCRLSMSGAACSGCLPDDGYRSRTLDLTRERLASLSGATIAVLSRYMAGELAAVGLADAAVTPPWLDVGSLPLDPGDRFLLAGRLVSHKAPERAVGAWRRAGARLPLVVAGDGPLADRLDGAEGLGWLAHRRLRAEMRRSRALLFPSRWQEPFGIVGIESLAEGTPVIVERSGGVVDWAVEGCLVVDAGDRSAMAEAVNLLDRDPGLALRLGAEGRAAVAERFSRSRCFPLLERLWERAAG